MNSNIELSYSECDDLIQKLKNRFLENMQRHANLDFNNIENKLRSNKAKVWALNQMEISGGEPDVVKYDTNTCEYIFYDCSKESPKGRRSLCYDQKV